MVGAISVPKRLSGEIESSQGVEIERLDDKPARMARSSGLDDRNLERLLGLLTQGVGLHPIEVYEDPETDILFVADGAHRLEAYRRKGIPIINAIIKSGDFEAAFVRACSANTFHGLALDFESKIDNLKNLLQRPNYHSLSNYALAGIVGLGSTSVQVYRNRWEQEGAIDRRTEISYSAGGIAKSMKVDGGRSIGGKPHSPPLDRSKSPESDNSGQADSQLELKSEAILPNFIVIQQAIKTHDNIVLRSPGDVVRVVGSKASCFVVKCGDEFYEIPKSLSNSYEIPIPQGLLDLTRQSWVSFQLMTGRCEESDLSEVFVYYLAAESRDTTIFDFYLDGKITELFVYAANISAAYFKMALVADRRLDLYEFSNGVSSVLYFGDRAETFDACFKQQGLIYQKPIGG